MRWLSLSKSSFRPAAVESRGAAEGSFRGRGAFRRFKDLVHRPGIQQQWYDFRDREVERIVADWLDTQGIAYER